MKEGRKPEHPEKNPDDELLCQKTRGAGGLQFLGHHVFTDSEQANFIELPRSSVCYLTWLASCWQSRTFLCCVLQSSLRTRGRYHGGRRPSSDDSFHSPIVIPPSAIDDPSIMKRYHRRWATRWGVTARSPTMVTLHDTRFVECRWWNDGWTVKTVVTWPSSASMIPAPQVAATTPWRLLPLHWAHTLDSGFDFPL